MADAGPPWCTIESDPGVFTELIHTIGVKDVQVEELWSLDEGSFANLQRNNPLIMDRSPVHGLIFLFKLRPEDMQQERAVTSDYNPTEVFFARQVITNACATQAILSILLNIPNIELGPELTPFKEFTAHFDAEMRGLAISNSEIIRDVHNSFARPEPFVGKSDVEGGTDDDVYHFISYVPIGGSVYELDGLQSGPIKLGDIGAGSWLDVARPTIEERINTYQGSEIRFNLMAVVGNRARRMEREIEELERRLRAVNEKLGVEPAGQGDAMDIEGEARPEVKESTPEELRDAKERIISQLRVLREDVKAEKEKFERWRVENTRRKHNYIPFIVNFLRILAEKGELVPLIEQSRPRPPSHGST